jgi:hypothetical protein
MYAGLACSRFMDPGSRSLRSLDRDDTAWAGVNPCGDVPRKNGRGVSYGRELTFSESHIFIRD